MKNAKASRFNYWLYNEDGDLLIYNSLNYKFVKIKHENSEYVEKFLNSKESFRTQGILDLLFTRGILVPEDCDELELTQGLFIDYIQCEVNVFTVSEKAKNLMAYACKLHLGDGLQNSLADFLHKTAGNRTDMMQHFDVALREKNTKNKIIDFAYVEQKVPEEKEKKTKRARTLGKE